MKPVTDEQLAGHNRATYRGIAEGLGASLLATSAGGWYLNRRFPGWRSMPPSFKALAAVLVIVPAISVQAERRGVAFDETTWEGTSVTLLNDRMSETEARWQAMKPTEKVSDWAARHQYSLIMGGWALSLATAGVIISRDKYQTFPQKIVQARMWAQGLTIGILIAAGAMTASKRAEAADHPFANTDHSWRDLLEEQEREKKVKALMKSSPGSIRAT